MPTPRRIHSIAGARRRSTAAVASAVIAVAGIALVTGDESEASRPSSSHPTSEHAAPGCPKPRCWWVPTSRKDRRCQAAAATAGATSSRATAYPTRDPVPIALATDREYGVAASPAA